MKLSTIILLFSVLFVVACGQKDAEEARQNLIGDWKGIAIFDRGSFGGTSFFGERKVRVSIRSDESAIIDDEFLLNVNDNKYSWSYQSDPEAIIFESDSSPETKYIMTILKNDENKQEWRANRDVSSFTWAPDTNLVALDTFLIRDSLPFGTSGLFLNELWKLERE